MRTSRRKPGIGPKTGGWGAVGLLSRIRPSPRAVAACSSVLVVLLLLALVPIPTAKAAPVRFAEGFTNETVGTTLPTGWTESGTGDALVSDARFKPQSPSLFVRADGTGDMDAWSPDYTNITDMTGNWTFEFNLNVDETPFSLSGFHVGIARRSSVSNVGITIQTDGSVYVARDGGCALDTGTDISEDAWHSFRFEATGRLTADTYSVILDNSTITSGCSLNGNIGGGGGAEANVHIIGIDGGDGYVDNIVWDELNVFAPSDSIICGPFVGSFFASTDGDEHIWSLDAASVAAGFLIAPNGIVGEITGPTVPTGLYNITVFADSPQGSANDTWTLEVIQCALGGAGDWLTTFGPNWAAFLAILALLAYITYRFKVNWDAKKGDRRIKRGQWWKSRLGDAFKRRSSRERVRTRFKLARRRGR